MDTIKVVLADDDAGMRLVVRHMLERVEGFTLVARPRMATPCWSWWKSTIHKSVSGCGDAG